LAGTIGCILGSDVENIGKESLEEPRIRWKDYIVMYLQEREWYGCGMNVCG